MKILLMDSQQLFCDGLRHILQQSCCAAAQVLAAGCFADGMQLAAQHPDLDLLLLEPNLTGGNGVVAIRRFCRNFPRVPILVVSGEENAGFIKAALRNGASGFVRKSSGERTLLEVLNAVLAGRTHMVQGSPRRLRAPDSKGRQRSLTPRQTQIFRQLLAGLSNKEIARENCLAAGTVKTHVTAIYQALGIRRRAEAVQAARRFGYFPVSPPREVSAEGRALRDVVASLRPSVSLAHAQPPSGQVSSPPQNQ